MINEYMGCYVNTSNVRAFHYQVEGMNAQNPKLFATCDQIERTIVYGLLPTFQVPALLNTHNFHWHPN